MDPYSSFSSYNTNENRLMAAACENVASEIQKMDRQGLDVHTVTVTLDNGGVRYTVLATDEELEPVTLEISV